MQNPETMNTFEKPKIRL